MIDEFKTIDDVFARIRVDGTLETSSANQCLQDYCRLGPARSLSKLLDQYAEQSAAVDAGEDVDLPPTVHEKTVKRWSSTYRFVERAEAYDRLIAEERIKLDEQERLEERKRRRAVLQEMHNRLYTFMENMDDTDVKQNRVLIAYMKDYMDQSRREWNDEPQQRVDVTTGDQPIKVQFITEPVPQSAVNEHLVRLGLADFARETSEHDIDEPNYAHLELASS